MKNLKGALLDFLGWFAYYGLNIIFGILILIIALTEWINKSMLFIILIIGAAVYFYKLYVLLKEISGDIYDIKKHLKLKATPRTRWQVWDSNRSAILEIIKESGNFDDVRDLVIEGSGIRHWGRMCGYAKGRFEEAKKQEENGK